MTKGKITRIALWNAVSLAEQLGASLTFTSEVAGKLSVEMGEESNFFQWTKNEHEQTTFTRNTQ